MNPLCDDNGRKKNSTAFESQRPRSASACAGAGRQAEKVVAWKPHYQPSIQVVICSVALAMCFSTVLMANW
jgi:hypothetical protein